MCVKRRLFFVLFGGDVLEDDNFSFVVPDCKFALRKHFHQLADIGRRRLNNVFVNAAVENELDKKFARLAARAFFPGRVNLRDLANFLTALKPFALLIFLLAARLFHLPCV